MTREHLFFIPFIFALGFIAGALAMRKGATEEPPTRSGRQVLIAGALVVFVFVATHALSTHGGARQIGELLAGQAILDQRPSFTADEVYERIARFGTLGRAAYQKMTYTSDLLFPLALFYFLVRQARHVARLALPSSSRALGLVTLLPLLWLTTDLAENAILYTLLSQFPVRSDALAAILGAVTDLKFGLLVASVVVPAVVLAVARKPNTRPKILDGASVAG